MGEVRYLLGLMSNEEAPQFSGFIQVDAAAEVEEVDEVGSGGVQRCRCVARERLKTDEEARGKVTGTPGPIYKAGRISGMCGNRGDHKMDMCRRRRIDFRRFIKRKDLLRFGLCVILMTGDVTAGYHNRRR